MNLSCEMKQHGFISQVLEMRKQVETHNKKPADIQGRDPPSHSYSKPLLVNDTPSPYGAPTGKSQSTMAKLKSLTSGEGSK